LLEPAEQESTWQSLPSRERRKGTGLVVEVNE
jgi:hypothetical protein